MRDDSPPASARGRSGASLIEAVAALTLTGLVIALVVGSCIAQMRLARATAERAVAAEALRTVRSVLSGEARRSTAADVRASSADSLAVRAFRGTALPCGATATGVLVRYTGDRLPDAAKDSVLEVGPSGTTAVLLDTRPMPGACAVRPDEVVLEWRLGSPVPGAAVLLLFESGSYHLENRALRYRIGAGGRQPLTSEVLRHPASRFGPVSARAIHFDVHAGGLSSLHAAPFAPAPVRP